MKSVTAIIAAACFLVPPAAADLKFTDNLRFATKTFLTVRLDDGRVIDARLPKTGPVAAAAILGQSE